MGSTEHNDTALTEFELQSHMKGTSTNASISSCSSSVTEDHSVIVLPQRRKKGTSNNATANAATQNNNNTTKKLTDEAAEAGKQLTSSKTTEQEDIGEVVTPQGCFLGRNQGTCIGGAAATKTSKSRSFSSADESDGDGGGGEGEDDAVEGSVLFDDLQDDTRALTSFARKRVRLWCERSWDETDQVMPKWIKL